MKNRLSSEQYVIDKDNTITIPYSVIYNAGLGSVTEFNIMEKSDVENVYCIVPATDSKEKGYEFVQKVTCTEEEGMKIDVKGMFELKPDETVDVDVYEFKLFLFDRASVIKNNEEEKEKKETGEMKNLFDCFGFNPYAPDDDSLQLMKENLDRDLKRLDNISKKKKDKGLDYNDLNNDLPSIEELDQMFGSFIDDMLARVYGQGGKKVVMISSDELDQFVKDMTWWYKRIKKGE